MVPIAPEGVRAWRRPPMAGPWAGLLALLALWLPVQVVAQGTTGGDVRVDAFSVEVAVADRSDAERQAAYAAALRRVLLANSGDKTLINRDEVRDGLRDAESFVETYRYRTPEPGTLIPADTPVTDLVRSSGEATGLLLVRFDPVRVMRLVDGGEPVGEARAARPRGDTGARGADGTPSFDEDGNPIDPFAGVRSALVWLVIDDDERTIRGSDPEAQKVRERLREIAGGGGVSLIFPVDEPAAGAPSGLPDAALRDLDEAAIREASLRYRADAVLVGHLARGDAVDDAGTDAGGRALETAPGAADAPVSRVRRERGEGRTARGAGEGWRGTWTRLAPGRATVEAADPARPTASADTPIAGVQSTTRQDARLDDALQGGIAWLRGDATLGQPADYEYGGTGSDVEGLVRFSGVGSLTDYTRVLALLEALPGVASVYPKEAADTAMVFAVLPRSALGDVARRAEASGWLRRTGPPVDGEASELARNAELSFDILR